MTSDEDAGREPASGQPQLAATGFDAALWHRQDVLSDLRHWIETRPGITVSGYITNINDPDAGSTILVWHGPPDRIQRQIVDEARRRHIPLSIQQRNHSRDELEQAADRIIAIAPGTGELHNFKISAVAAFTIDFDGVTVIGDYLHPPAEGVALADGELCQALATKTGVAVTIEHGEFVPL